jgi:hypothetical protein
LAVELNETRRAWAPNYHSLARFFDAAGGLSRAFRMVPTGVDPLAGSIAISNCDRSGYYDTTFGGVAPVYVHSRSAAVPSFGLLSDGWGNHGRELNLQLQAAEVARMSQPAMLAALHRYRAPGDTDAVKEHLPWLQ